MYKLICLLHKETLVLEVKMRLLNHAKMQRITCNSQATIHAKLEQQWADFDAGRKSSDDLLRACARLYAPENSDPNYICEPTIHTVSQSAVVIIVIAY